MRFKEGSIIIYSRNNVKFKVISYDAMFTDYTLSPLNHNIYANGQYIISKHYVESMFKISRKEKLERILG